MRSMVDIICGCISAGSINTIIDILIRVQPPAAGQALSCRVRQFNATRGILIDISRWI